MLRSLNARLIAAFVAVTVVALLLAGGFFVLSERDDQEQARLDRVAAAYPEVVGEISRRGSGGADEAELATLVDEVAAEQEVRVLLVNTEGTVLKDSEDRVDGQQIVVPEGSAEPLEEEQAAVDTDATATATASMSPPQADTADPQHDFGSGFPFGNQGWTRYGGRHFDFDPQTGDEGRLVLIEPPGPFSPGSAQIVDENQYFIYLAVRESTLTTAWLDMLPGLALAAAIALPVAILLAVLLARYIVRPLNQLETAAQAIAHGSYDVQVPDQRRDEVGSLARAFSYMAQRVGESQSQMRALVANVSHDLRTPLTSILGFTRAVRDGDVKDPAEIRRSVDVAHEEALRLNNRLNDLLYISELDSGQAVLQKREVDIDQLVAGLVDRIRPELEARDVRLGLSLDSNASFEADHGKLERALENLIDNARKYVPDGGVVDVKTSTVGDGAVIEITNTAPDLSEEELPRLFERFYRRDGSRGSGLGLAIACELIELHGGTLTAELVDDSLRLTVSLP
jgi:signal transduction histidine kinase